MGGWASHEPGSLSGSGGCLVGETGLVEEAAHRSHARYVSLICQLHVSYMSVPLYLGLVKEVVTLQSRPRDRRQWGLQEEHQEGLQEEHQEGL